jgi:hypothetical protein
MNLWGNILNMLFGLAVCVLVLIVYAIVKGVVGIVRQIIFFRRNLLSFIQNHADEAYDLFVANLDDWVVFRGIPPESTVTEIPRCNNWICGRKPYGPSEFRVPRLRNGIVTVFGISADCAPELMNFMSQEQKKETPPPVLETPTGEERLASVDTGVVEERDSDPDLT